MRGLLPVERRIKSAETVALRARAAEEKTEAAFRRAEVEERRELTALGNRRRVEASREQSLQEQRLREARQREERERVVQERLESLRKTNTNVGRGLGEKQSAYRQDAARREYAREYQQYLEECRKRQNMNARVQVRIEEEFRRQVVQKRQEQRVTQAHLRRLEYLLELKEREREVLASNRENERRIAAQKTALAALSGRK